MKKSWVKAVVALVWISGNIAPLALMWLLWPRLGSPKAPVADETSALAIDCFLALLFPIQHSLWTQAPIKRALTARLTEYFERPLYVFTSGLALVVIVVFWQCTDRVFWAAPSAGVVWAMRALFVAIIAAQFHCVNVVGPKFLQGMTHLEAFEEGMPVRQPEFRERGLYSRVRHPIAMTQVIMIWVASPLSSDRLLLSIVWTLWIVGSTALEDRRLGKEFGETYAAYRKRAGFLWPKLG